MACLGYCAEASKGDFEHTVRKHIAASHCTIEPLRLQKYCVNVCTV